MQRAAAQQASDDVTRLPLYLEAGESVFVVFDMRHSNPFLDPVTAMTLDGRPLLDAGKAAKITIVKAIYGVPGDEKRTRDVTAKLQALIDSGPTSFTVAEMARGDDPAYMVVKTLTIDYTLDGKPRKASGAGPRHD